MAQRATSLGPKHLFFFFSFPFFAFSKKTLYFPLHKVIFCCFSVSPFVSPSLFLPPPFSLSLSLSLSCSCHLLCCKIEPAWLQHCRSRKGNTAYKTILAHMSLGPSLDEIRKRTAKRRQSYNVFWHLWRFMMFSVRETRFWDPILGVLLALSFAKPFPPTPFQCSPLTHTPKVTGPRWAPYIWRAGCLKPLVLQWFFVDLPGPRFVENSHSYRPKMRK